MGMLIDLCGTPMQLEQIKSFRLVKREYLFCPAYRETEDSSWFTKLSGTKKKFEFTQMVPFGALLNDKEKPFAGGYEIKSFGEALTFSLLTELGRVAGDAAGFAADKLKIDTSGNKEYHILTQGRRTIKVKLRDIPAKVSFRNGKVSDVYKHDPNYALLDDTIMPTVSAVPTLVVAVGKTTYVFFGGGVDLEDAEGTYHSLLEAYNQFQTTKEKPKALPKLNINLPKITMPTFKFQSPFGPKKETIALPEESTELNFGNICASADKERATQMLDGNDDEVK